MIRAMTRPKDTTRAGKRAAQQRAAAERARDYRARLKAAGVPDARAVDAALSEALAFHVAKQGVGPTGVNIGVVVLMRTARLVLEREGHAPAVAAQAVAGRLSHRDEHLDPHHVPTLRPGPPDRFRPTKAGPWTTPMPAILAHLVG